ncbi:hypothetical protein BACERE00221_03605 [Bacillus paranthracis]|uniref:Uncharacterized protein n=1 Tax=Bacillus paranthracis TaxID=2026186 RepID=A0A9X8SJ45_9BACI|nr:hypothetical protein BACERE00221_03605 [Bacillus paranthracis]
MSEFQSGKREGYIYGYIGVQPAFRKKTTLSKFI